MEQMQGVERNYAKALQTINVNICSKGTNSCYLIYTRLQIGSFMVYQHIPFMTPFGWEVSVNDPPPSPPLSLSLSFSETYIEVVTKPFVNQISVCKCQIRLGG